MCCISVIIPAYNVEKYIVRTVNSLKNQSFSSWEALIIDDGSTDKTFDILIEITSNDNRFKVFHTENGGVSSARNLGITEAKGKYVYFLDSDDVIMEKALELLYSSAEVNAAEIVICGFEEVSDDGKVQDIWLPVWKDSISSLYEDLIKRYGINTLCNKLFLRDKIIMFDIYHSMGEDLKFCCDYLVNINRYSLVTESLYQYYIDNPGSLTKHVDLKMDAIMYDTNNLLKLVKELNIAEGIVMDRLYSTISGNLLRAKNEFDFFYIYNNMMKNELKNIVLFYSPFKFNYKIIRYLILRNYRNTLFFIFKIKRYLQNINASILNP